MPDIPAMVSHTEHSPMISHAGRSGNGQSYRTFGNDEPYRSFRAMAAHASHVLMTGSLISLVPGRVVWLPDSRRLKNMAGNHKTSDFRHQVRFIRKKGFPPKPLPDVRERIRTLDLLIRSQTLYPAELHVHFKCNSCIIADSHSFVKHYF